MKKYLGFGIVTIVLSSFAWIEGDELFNYEIIIPAQFKKYLPIPLVFTNKQIIKGKVELGRRLFYDPILSADSTQSCASCHALANAFTDNGRSFSTGVDGMLGNRNSMTLINLAYMNSFFWDGRSKTIQQQAFQPVSNPLEMHAKWEDVVDKVQKNTMYLEKFKSIYGQRDIDSSMITEAIAQFELTLISGNSKFDQYLNGTEELTDSEKRGVAIYMSENKGRCFHCHGGPNNPLYTDNQFHNNGLDSVFSDLGLADFTGNQKDKGLFKTPTLRNLSFTAPYMHDGRFKTIEEVINHYSEGIVWSPTLDPSIVVNRKRGIHLNDEEKNDLKSFLLTLNDSSFVSNRAFMDPFLIKKLN